MRTGPINRTTLSTLAAHAAGAVIDFPTTLTDDNSSELGRFLRHVLSPSGPDAVPEHLRSQWLRRAPGYDLKPERMTEAQRLGVVASWEAALGAFEAIEKELGLERFRLPLPNTFEVLPLRDETGVIGLLCESPEAIDFTRVKLENRLMEPGETPGVAESWETVALVPNRDNTRFFVFKTSGSAVQAWTEGIHALRFQFHRVVGDRYPPLRHPDGEPFETAILIFDLANDRFTPEGS
jgi:hypothetical protein